MIPLQLVNPGLALLLMWRHKASLVCIAGSGEYFLQSNEAAVRLSSRAADELLENGLVSLAPNDDFDDLIFLLTAEGRRQARRAGDKATPSEAPSLIDAALQSARSSQPERGLAL